MGYDPEVLLRALAAGGKPDRLGGSQMVPEDLMGMKHKHEGMFNPEATLDPSRMFDTPAPEGFTYWPPEPGFNIVPEQNPFDTHTMQWDTYLPQSAPFDYLGAVMRILKKRWGKQDDNGEVDWI